MDTDFNNIIANSDNIMIWQAIAGNQIVAAKEMIDRKMNPEVKSWWNILKKPEIPSSNVILKLTSEILAATPKEKLSDIILSAKKEDGSGLFAELNRLFFSLLQNGNFTTQIDDVTKIVIDTLVDLAEQVRIESNGYPSVSMNGGIWFTGASIRDWCSQLSAYFVKTNNLTANITVLQSKCKITCSIMSHYPHMVGPDMIEAAIALEAIGNIDLAINYYNAVIADFEHFADSIRDNPDEVIYEEEIISLNALLQGYKQMNRLKHTTQFDNNIQFIHAIIERGATEVQEENE